jgi:hypothetical protein
VLLLDGLDELPSERQAKCVQAINQFLGGEFSPLHLVVCSRKEEYEDYEEMLHLNGAICLEDLTNEQIRHYFASVNLGEFWESIKGSEKIVDFIRQPLFLAISSLAYQQIDVDEWRNCNTEQKSIDYLLGIYRGEMLRRTKNVQYHIPKIEALQYQKCLNRLAKNIQKEREFRVEDIDLNFINSSFTVRLINHISLSIPFLIFPLVVLLPFLQFKLDFIFVPAFYLGVIYFSFVKENEKKEWLAMATFFIVFTIMISPYAISYHFFKEEPVSMGDSGAIIVFYFYFLVEMEHSRFKDTDRNIPPKLSEITKRLHNIKTMCTNFIFDFFITKKIVILSFFLFLAAFLFLYCINSHPGVPEWLVMQTPNNKHFWASLINVLRIILWATIIFLFVVGFFVVIFSMVMIPGFLLFLFFSIISGFFMDIYNLLRRYIFRIYLGMTGQMYWNITRFLDDCTERLILQRVGNRYRFIHRLVQEHFANLEIQKE